MFSTAASQWHPSEGAAWNLAGSQTGAQKLEALLPKPALVIFVSHRRRLGTGKVVGETYKEGS